MMGRRIQMRQLTQIIALVVLGIFWGASVEAGAAEQRCNQLGANCACSEPLNTPTYTLAAGANWGWNPADSTTKECAIEGLAGAVYSIATLGINTKFGTNDSTILGALPAGHTNTYVLRGEDGYTGQWFLGHQFSGSVSHVRRAMRFYHYYSNPYQQASTASCGNNGKLTQLGPSGGVTTNSAGGAWAIYSWNASSQPQDAWVANPVVKASSAQPDCCSAGPGSDAGAQSALSLSKLQGHWVRTEMIVKNSSGTPGFVFQMYMKDVTANGPEYKVIDTSIACSAGVCGAGTGWVAPDYTANFDPPKALNDFWMDLFRNGTCTGFQAVSHILAAAWDTDAGQRIGAAVEIEGGGGGDTTAPAAPTNLIVSMLIEEE